MKSGLCARDLSYACKISLGKTAGYHRVRDQGSRPSSASTRRVSI
jgi:hypothetical protein